MPTTPYLAVEYEEMPGVAGATRPAMEAVFTMWPPSPAATMPGRNAWIP